MHRLFGAAVLAGMLVCATAASAQTSFARAYLDVNFGVTQVTKSDLDSTFHTTIFQETATFTTVYTQGNGVLFDIGGGFMFNKKFGVGVSYAMTGHNDDVLMTATVPHPNIFNANGTGSGTATVKGAEADVNISAVLVLMDSGKMKIRILAGPSFIAVKQEIVEDFFYHQSISGATNTITVSASDAILQSPTQTTNLVGFHVGGDFAYFFSKVFGVGGMARFVAAGSKDITDPFALAPNTITIKGGGFQVGGGIRLRF